MKTPIKLLILSVLTVLFQGACSIIPPELLDSPGVWQNGAGGSQTGTEPCAASGSASQGCPIDQVPPAVGSLTYVDQYPLSGTDTYPEVIAFSPDGRHVYVGVDGLQIVKLFARASKTGALTHVADYSHPTLNSPSAIAVSPDGRHVYVSTGEVGGMVWFKRSVADGTLEYQGIARTDKLAFANSLVVTSDGKNIYAASMSDNSVVWFDREQTTGEPLYVGSDAGQNDDVGFWGPSAIALAKGERHAYVIHFDTGAVFPYERDVSNDRLVRKSPTLGPNYEMSDARALSISPDGKSIYVAAIQNHNVTLLSRDADTGLLTYVESYPGKLYEGGYAVAVSPDGKNVFVPSDYVVRYARDPNTGKLTKAEELVDSRTAGASFLAFAPDGAHVYILCNAGIAWLRVN